MRDIRLTDEGSKYQQVKSNIKKWILSGEVDSGGKIPAETQVAEWFGISRHTVRQAIGELVSEGWLYREQGRGTFVHGDNARTASDAVRHGSIGVVTTYLVDYIFPHIISGIEGCVSERRQTLSLFSTGNNVQMERRCLETALAEGVQGFIIEPTKSTHPNPNIDLYLLMEQKNIPFVMLHSSYVELNASVVAMDDAQGSYMVTKHLIELGHQSIAGIFKSDDMQGRARFRGFVKAHQDHHVPIQGHWIQTYTTEERDGGAAIFVQKHFAKGSKPRPTSVVCYNDEIAVQVISQLRTLGLRVPEDVAVTGFDDSSLAVNSAIPLTTIRHPKDEMGKAAANLLFELMENRENMWVPREHIFPPELVVRASTAAPST